MTSQEWTSFESQESHGADRDHIRRQKRDRSEGGELVECDGGAEGDADKKDGKDRGGKDGVERNFQATGDLGMFRLRMSLRKCAGAKAPSQRNDGREHLDHGQRKIAGVKQWPCWLWRRIGSGPRECTPSWLRL